MMMMKTLCATSLYLLITTCLTSVYGSAIQGHTIKNSFAKKCMDVKGKDVGPNQRQIEAGTPVTL